MMSKLEVARIAVLGLYDLKYALLTEAADLRL